MNSYVPQLHEAKQIDMSYDNKLSIYYASCFNDIAQTYCCVAHRLLHLLLLYTCKNVKSTDSKESVSEYVSKLQWIQNMKDPRDVVTFLMYIPSLKDISNEIAYSQWITSLYINIADSYQRSFASRTEDIISTGTLKLNVGVSVPNTVINTLLDYGRLGRMLESIRDDIYNKTLPNELNASDKIVWMLQGEHRIDVHRLLDDGATEICRALMVYDDMDTEYRPKEANGRFVLIKLRERSSTNVLVRYLRRDLEIDAGDYAVNATLYVQLHRATVETSVKGSIFIALSPDEEISEPKPRFLYRHISDVLLKRTR